MKRRCSFEESTANNKRSRIVAENKNHWRQIDDLCDVLWSTSLSPSQLEAKHMRSRSDSVSGCGGGEGGPAMYSAKCSVSGGGVRVARVPIPLRG